MDDFSLSDSEVFDGQRIQSLRLDQRSRLIVLPRKDSSLKDIPQMPELRKVGLGIFLVETRKRRIIEFLEDIPHIRFRKAREIPKGDQRKKAPFQERIYSIAVFSFEKPTQQQKKRMQRIIQRTACVRLRPGVFLFPHLRTKEKARYFLSSEGVELLDSNGFAREAKSLGASIKRWSRLRLVNKQGEDLVHQAYKRMIHHEAHSIETKLKKIQIRLKDASTSSKKLREQYTLQSRKFRLLRFRYRILKALWDFDEDKELKRVYNFMLKVRRKIQDRRPHESHGVTIQTGSDE